MKSGAYRFGFGRLAVIMVGAVLASMVAAAAHAIPTLQVGAPAGPGDTGQFADYQGSLSNPTEDDTAVTYGNTLLVGGIYGNNVRKLGGQYSNSGADWSDLGFPSAFNDHGAVLMVSVPKDQTGTVTIDLGDGDLTPFFTSSTSYFPNNHAPVQSSISKFLYFDIGTFSKIDDAVPNFDEESGAADGEIKEIAFEVTGFDWAHFDVMAIETSKTGSKFKYSVKNNPPSKDVTWKSTTGSTTTGTTTGTNTTGTTTDTTTGTTTGTTGETTFGGTTTNGDNQEGAGAVPEPATAALAGLSLAGLALITRRRR